MISGEGGIDSLASRAHPSGGLRPSVARLRRTRFEPRWVRPRTPHRQIQKGPAWGPFSIYWRRGWDSNPRYGVTVYLNSNQAPSTTRPPLRGIQHACAAGARRLTQQECRFNPRPPQDDSASPATEAAAPARLRFTCRHRRLSSRLLELSGKTPRCGCTPPGNSVLSPDSSTRRKMARIPNEKLKSGLGGRFRIPEPARSGSGD